MGWGGGGQLEVWWVDEKREMETYESEDHVCGGCESMGYTDRKVGMSEVDVEWWLES